MSIHDRRRCYVYILLLCTFWCDSNASGDQRFDSPASPLQPLSDVVPIIEDREPTSAISPAMLRQLMRPTLNVSSEWQSKVDAVQLTSHAANLQIPSYPVFGPPPPFVSVGFAYTDLDAPASFDLPDNLYEYSLGLAWMRPVNDRWMLRLMLGTAHATDGHNRSSDSWQFRGGAFALFRPNEQWTWIFGALALGRNDIPVVPAVGAIYQPTCEVRFDLTMPKPKVAVLLVDQGPRQQWGYLGTGLSGGTWGYERANGQDDQLTYGDWRLVLGWESIPTPAPGMPFTRGRKLGVEVGYVFARDFEFERGRPDLELDNVWMLSGRMSF